MGVWRCGWVPILLLGALPAAAQGLPGDPAAGREIADGWCIACHDTAPGLPEPMIDGPPPFQVIADHPATTEMALRAFLQSPHASMPNVRPTAEQTDHLIAYILSLKGRQPDM